MKWQISISELSYEIKILREKEAPGLENILFAQITNMSEELKLDQL
jgi:hypothetical protein